MEVDRRAVEVGDWVETFSGARGYITEIKACNSRSAGGTYNSYPTYRYTLSLSEEKWHRKIGDFWSFRRGAIRKVVRFKKLNYKDLKNCKTGV